jgi:iron complex transport system substrate-binding protein
MRIASLLPSATEILYALDLGDSVAGVTFECDYPPEAQQKPILVDTVLAHDLSSSEIDRDVTEYAAHGDSIYRIHRGLLESIGVDLVVTQELCDVCAVSTSHLAKTLYGLSPQPDVLTLTPHTLEDVFADIESVGRATGCEQRAVELTRALRDRIEQVRAWPKRQSPKVACLEWLAPPFNAGHWVPEMVTIAGGIDRLGALGEYSTRIEWEQLQTLDPDVVIVMPCGYNAQAAADEFRRTELPVWWSDLAAVRSNRVYAVNATAYFSRPGPRLVDGVEVLYALLQQDGSQQLPDNAWVQL